MPRLSAFLPFVAAMALVVVASNVLVQFPVGWQVGSLALADILTWGAFTYPFAFLVTDLANRRYGPRAARAIVFFGFVLAVACSMLLPPLLYGVGIIGFETAADRLARIALASGSAFLFLQSVLGLEIDALVPRLTLRSPRLPDFVDRLDIERLKVGANSVDLRLIRHPDDVGVSVLRTSAPLDVVVVK